MKSRVLILKIDDWEGLYIDNNLVESDHGLGGGDRLFMLKMAEQYGFKSKDVKVAYANEADAEESVERGDFPQLRTDLYGNYR